MPNHRELFSPPAELLQILDTRTRDYAGSKWNEAFPRRSFEESLTVQLSELYLIRQTADRIETLLNSKGYKLPSVYMLNTAGIRYPFKSELLGHYQTDPPFELFPATDTAGHPGEVAIAKIDDQNSILSFTGRAHPYEWLKHPYGNMIAARPLRVVKELMRRQRERGKNPILIDTFLAGVYEGHPLEKGDLAIIVDDSELGNNTHPGLGQRALLDEWLGSRFQPKMERSGSRELMQGFYRTARGLGFNSAPAVAVGTPGDPEFENYFELALALNTFDRAKSLGLDTYIKKTFEDPQAVEDTALIFGMGISADLAVVREAFPGETDFPFLALALISDKVGQESIHTTHNSNVSAARSYQDQNTALLKQFILFYIRGQLEGIPRPNLPDESGFSLERKFWQAAQDQADSKAAEILIGEKEFPANIENIRHYLRSRVDFYRVAAKIYRLFGFPDIAQIQEDEGNNINDIAISLMNNNDGRSAYEFFNGQREIHLTAAKGRQMRMESFKEHPEYERGIYSDEILQKKKEDHLNKARFFEESARIIAQQKGIIHNPLKI